MAHPGGRTTAPDGMTTIIESDISFINKWGGDLVDNERLQEATVRCLSALLRYRNGEKTDAARSVMVAEIETLIGWLKELDLPPGALGDGVLRPVESYLLDRYGHEAGRRLNAEFVQVFERAGMDLLQGKYRVS